MPSARGRLTLRLTLRSLPQGDEVGISLWADNSRSVPYASLDLTAALRTTGNHAEATEVIVGTGVTAAFLDPPPLSCGHPYYS